MIPPIPQLITPEQELHGPGPINVPGWEFKTDEINTQAPNGLAIGSTVKIRVNPNLSRRRLFAYVFVVTAVAGFSIATVVVKYKGTPLLSIPFNFGVAAYSATQFSSGSLLGAGGVPTSGALQLTLSSPFNGSEGGTNPVYLYPMEQQGIMDEIVLTFLGSTAGAANGRLWLGCISQ